MDKTATNKEPEAISIMELQDLKKALELPYELSAIRPEYTSIPVCWWYWTPIKWQKSPILNDKE